MVKFWTYLTDGTNMISVQMGVECEKKREDRDDCKVCGINKGRIWVMKLQSGWADNRA